MTYAIARPEIGELAPPIILRDAMGNVWRLEDQQGRDVVLIFHRHIH